MADNEYGGKIKIPGLAEVHYNRRISDEEIKEKRQKKAQEREEHHRLKKKRRQFNKLEVFLIQKIIKDIEDV